MESNNEYRATNIATDALDFKSKTLLIIGKLIRTKRPEIETSDSGTKLKKCLTTIDLTSLGVGSCVGTGMYLVAGMVAHNTAGPGVALSFLIAAIASLLSGVCYAEFGVRVPNTTGSAYMYSYVTVGEFIAFVIGWNMILEYLIGTAAGACAISACINSIFGGSIGKYNEELLGTLVGHVPDILAAVITILMTLLLVTGVKKSLLFNNILNVVNFCTWIFIMFASLFFIDSNNWTQHGGFLPKGWSGVLSGAATCFYAFIGFDIIATTGEEAEDPKRSIPIAIIASMLVALTAYITSSLVVTLMVPWEKIDTDSALVEMFTYVGANGCKNLVALGALAGLTVSMLGSMFPMPRVVYAMAKDGLIFKQLSQIWPVTETPMLATVSLGAFTALVALVMSLDVLVEMMSIGTLMAYTLVSTCVLLLRYQPTRSTLVDLLPEAIRSACPTPIKETAPSFISNTPQFAPFVTTQQQRKASKRLNHYDSSDSDDTDPNCFRQESKDDEFLVPGAAGYHYGSVPYQHGGSSGKRSSYWDHYEKLCMYLFPYGWKVQGPATEETGLFVIKLVGLFFVVTIAFDVILVWFIDSLDVGDHLTVTIFIISLVTIAACIFAIARQPQIRCDLKFKAPGVPFVPAFAIVINIYLIFRLSILTLVRFTVWMTAGLVMYFCYGMKNSALEELYKVHIASPQSNYTSETTQQIELTIPKNRLQTAYASEQPMVSNKSSMYTTYNGRPQKSTTTELSSEQQQQQQRWQTFD